MVLDLDFKPLPDAVTLVDLVMSVTVKFAEACPTARVIVTGRLGPKV